MTSRFKDQKAVRACTIRFLNPEIGRSGGVCHRTFQKCSISADFSKIFCYKKTCKKTPLCLGLAPNTMGSFLFPIKIRVAGGDIYVRVFRIYLEMAPRPEQVLKQVLKHLQKYLLIFLRKQISRPSESIRKSHVPGKSCSHWLRRFPGKARDFREDTCA